MKRYLSLVCAASALAAVAGNAHAAELLTNGGFEDGTTNTNGSVVPDGWTPNAAYSADTNFARVDGSNPHSGNYGLVIGNYDPAPVDMLSQTFSDVAGALYSVSFYGFAGRGGDPDAFLTVSAGGNSTTFKDDINSYTLGTFTFTGTGSDTLTIAAATNPNDWYVDDVSVTGPSASSPAPEPAAWAMMIVGFLGVGGLMRHRRRLGVRYA